LANIVLTRASALYATNLSIITDSAQLSCLISILPFTRPFDFMYMEITEERSRDSKSNKSHSIQYVEFGTERIFLPVPIPFSLWKLVFELKESLSLQNPNQNFPPKQISTINLTEKILFLYNQVVALRLTKLFDKLDPTSSDFFIRSRIDQISSYFGEKSSRQNEQITGPQLMKIWKAMENELRLKEIAIKRILELEKNEFVDEERLRRMSIEYLKEKLETLLITKYKIQKPKHLKQMEINNNNNNNPDGDLPEEVIEFRKKMQQQIEMSDLKWMEFDFLRSEFSDERSSTKEILQKVCVHFFFCFSKIIKQTQHNNN